jgi:(p)ppGpp synthase/HD superfamily hydrolase
MNYLNDSQVLELATKAHQGQKREGGEPYITHPIAVAEIALKIAEANHYSGWMLSLVYQAAILHDVLEDTPISTQDLREAKVMPSVIEALYYLNKHNFSSYTDLIMTTKRNEVASMVKYADLTHNSSDLKKSSRLDKYNLAKVLIEIMNPELKFQ